MSNIAEGYERGSNKELIQFLKVAKGSVAEIRSQIYAAEDVGYIDQTTASTLRRSAIVITRQLAALTNTARSRQS